MKWWVRKVVAGVALFMVAVAVLSLVTMLLWNALIPQIFGGPSLSLIQAAGLLLLSHILFRGWSPRGRCGSRHHGWRSRFEKRLASMSPEERERLREVWKGRCGWGPEAPAESGTAPE